MCIEICSCNNRSCEVPTKSEFIEEKLSKFSSRYSLVSNQSIVKSLLIVVNSE